MSLFSRSVVVSSAMSALFLAGCSGGSMTADAGIGPTSGNLTIQSCDLGCTPSGCLVTEIAQNQRLRFTFSQPLASSTVNQGSFSIRTTTGEAPDGNLLVDANTVTFVPSIAVANGVSSFGFRRNESYIVTLASGAFGVRSQSGGMLTTPYSCTVWATRGIQDEDAAPPRAELIAPTNLTAAPIDSTIVLRFSEVVDTTAFLQPVSASTPIRYVLRRSRVPAGSTTRECNIDSEAIQVEGLPVVSLDTVNGRPVTTISLRPSLALPGLACLEVTITGDVRDISGRSAEERTFRAITAASAQTDTLIVEPFTNETRMDPDVSGGVWNDGARPAQLGGDGRHGSFNINNGVDVGSGVYQWNVDNFTIPGSQTFNGQPATINDGKFFFSDFVVPVGQTVRFTGSLPVQIFVRGKVEVNGRIQANGVDQVNFQSRNLVTTAPTNPVPGQQGSAGGPGGARGGQGGDRCFGTGPLPNQNGRVGEDLRLPAGHAYAAAVLGTGGRGSPLHPAHGLDASLSTPTNTYTTGGIFNSNVNLGGSGAGYSNVGLVATNTPVVPNVIQILPASAVLGGIIFDPLPVPSPTTSSLSHFLIGGAGGGGGGSHPFLGLSASAFTSERWKAGGGGTGGGGAIAIRAGRGITVTQNGRIEVKGGTGARINGDNPASPAQDSVNSPSGTHWGIPAPGGGGSGGTALLQASRDVVIEGVIDAGGGTGSFTDGILPNTGTSSCDIDSRGGNGAPGYYRLEALGAAAATNGANVPAYDAGRNSALLRDVDRDIASGCRSTWRSTGFVFPPEWIRYELQVDVDGDGTVDRTYSDDPSVKGSFGAAIDPLGPVTAKFQGARVNSIGVPDAATIRQWRDFVGDTIGIGINSDLPTGFRFQLLFNTAAFPNCVVKRRTVVTRG